MSQAVMGLVSDVFEANALVNVLLSGGFRNSDISLLMPDPTAVRDLACEKHSKATEGASVGASAGALLGAATGWLAGIGVLIVPGSGHLMISGPIMAALSGAAVGGAVGGATGGIIGSGLSKYEAKQYDGRRRSILISVHTESKEASKLAKEIFETVEAKDISIVGEQHPNQ